ncbi:MAG: hypothetical protein Q9227_008742 [Pyrenula ochraceoflavens]
MSPDPYRRKYRDDRDDDYLDSEKPRRHRHQEDSPPRANITKGRKPVSDRHYVDEALSDSGSDSDPRNTKRTRPSATKTGRGKPRPELRDDSSAIHDLERKNTEANKKFRHKRDGYLSDEGEKMKESKKGKASASYSDDDGPDPRGPSRRHTEDYAPRHKGRDYYDDRDEPRRRPRDYDEYEPPRRSNTTRDRDRDRHRHHDDYESPRPRRRYDDDDRGYRSDGRPSRKGHGDGYGSDRGHRRHGRSVDDYDRRDRDRYGGRDRYYSDRDRDYDRRDRDRDRKKKGGLSLNAKDIGRYVETGQKHYQTVAPIVNQLAKMYMDRKK